MTAVLSLWIMAFPYTMHSMTKLGKILTTPWFYRTPTILKSRPIASTLQTTFQHIPLKTAKTTNPLPRTFQPVFSFRHNAGIPACGFVCPKTKPCPQTNPQPKTENQKKQQLTPSRRMKALIPVKQTPLPPLSQLTTATKTLRRSSQ